VECENFAHRYAAQQTACLQQQGLIPWDAI
jgi:hypothetical protein